VTAALSAAIIGVGEWVGGWVAGWAYLTSARRFLSSTILGHRAVGNTRHGKGKERGESGPTTRSCLPAALYVLSISLSLSRSVCVFESVCLACSPFRSLT